MSLETWISGRLNELENGIQFEHARKHANQRWIMQAISVMDVLTKELRKVRSQEVLMTGGDDHGL